VTLLALEANGLELSRAVSVSEYARLLGLPQAKLTDGALAQAADAARAWYARHGRPFVAARRVPVARLDAEGVRLATGDWLSSAALSRRLRKDDAHAVVVMAASAGPEVAEEADRLWSIGCPDDAYFLDRFGAAVAERLVAWSATGLCQKLVPAGESLLGHLSPGCLDWELGDQHRLWRLLFGSESPVSRSLRLLDTGVLFPRHSLLAACGVSRHSAVTGPGDPCRACGMPHCAFRRVQRASTGAGSLEAR
jgi:hypothetical protein